MKIEEFHKLYWSGGLHNVYERMYFSKKPNDRSYHEDASTFSPYYTTSDKSKPQELHAIAIKDMCKSIDITTLHGNMITIGEYKIYFYLGFKKPDDFYKGQTEHKFSVIMEYHGYRHRILAIGGYKYDDNRYYGNNYEGFIEVFDLIKEYAHLIEPYDINECVLGPKFADEQYVLSPYEYPQIADGKYEWSSLPSGEIELDHFILMETSGGVYKPSPNIIYKLIIPYGNQPKLKRTEFLKDLGIHTIQFKNNSAFDITKQYNLSNVEVKASKSVLEKMPNLRDYCKDTKAISAVLHKEEMEKKAYELLVYNDTFSLVQHGKVVLENVRSYQINEYLQNRENDNFEKQAFEAAKKAFEAAPELNKIFFMSYGIHAYTELAGEKFVNYEDIERINKMMSVVLPPRIIKLHQLSALEFPTFDTDDSAISFDRGATYVGVEKDSKGKFKLVYETGEDDI